MFWLTKRRLKSGDASIRLDAVTDLRWSINPKALALLAECTKDPDSAVRAEAARSIRQIAVNPSVKLKAEHCRQTADALCALLTDSAATVRESAASALQPVLKHADVDAERLAQLLCSEHRNVRKAVLKVLKGERWSPRTERQNAFFAAADGSPASCRGDEGVDALILILQTGDRDERKEAAWHLGQRQDQRVVVPLLEALKDEESWVRSAAARALAEAADPSSVPALIELLNDESIGVQRDAVYALGKSQAPNALDALISRLWDPHLTAAIVAALAELQVDSAVDVFQQVILRGEVSNRRTAVRALADIGDPRTTQALIHALADSDDEVRELAARALADLGAGLDPAARTRAAAARKDWNGILQIGQEEANRPIVVNVLRELLDKVERRKHTSGAWDELVRLLGLLADDPESLRSLLRYLEVGELLDSVLFESLDAIAARQRVLGLAHFTYVDTDRHLDHVRARLKQSPDTLTTDELVRLSQLEWVTTVRVTTPVRGEYERVLEVISIGCKDITKLATRERARRAGK